MLEILAKTKNDQPFLFFFKVIFQFLCLVWYKLVEKIEIFEFDFLGS